MPRLTSSLVVLVAIATASGTAPSCPTTPPSSPVPCGYKGITEGCDFFLFPWAYIYHHYCSQIVQSEGLLLQRWDIQHHMNSLPEPPEDNGKGLKQALGVIEKSTVTLRMRMRRIYRWMERERFDSGT